jgi:hypothetical protein
MGAADQLQRVITSEPINRMARTVMQRGTHYEGFKLPNGAIHSEDPLPMIPVPYGIKSRIGEKMGRFTVVGFSRRGNAEHIWIVRCSCGRYEPRSTAALNRRAKDSALSEAKCFWCVHVDRLRAKGLKANSAPLTRREPPPGKKWCGNKECSQWIMSSQELCWECLPGQLSDPRNKALLEDLEG